LNIQLIDEIYTSYLILKDSVRVTKRTIDKNISSVHNRTIFIANESTKSFKTINDSFEVFEDLTVLSLFATFERELRSFLIEKIDILKNIQPNDLALKIFEHSSKEIEWWKIEEIISIFDFCIEPHKIGIIKQILQYRNWIAHGKNPNKLPSAKIDSKTTYEKLKNFMEEVIEKTNIDSNNKNI